MACHWVSLVTLGVLLCAFTGFVVQRGAPHPPLVLVPSSVPPHTPSGVPVNATAACLTACGDQSTCQVNATSGVVQACLTCRSGYVAVQRSCVVDPQCGAYPWCSDAEAVVTQNVHEGLLQAAIDLPLTAGGVYPSTATWNMTHSSNWTTMLAPALHSNASQAIALVNLFVAAQTPSFALAWFDDQSAWFASSLPAYVAAVPAALAPYLHALKGAVCTHHWALNTTSGACVAPAAL